MTMWIILLLLNGALGSLVHKKQSSNSLVQSYYASSNEDEWDKSLVLKSLADQTNDEDASTSTTTFSPQSSTTKEENEITSTSFSSSLPKTEDEKTDFTQTTTSSPKERSSPSERVSSSSSIQDQNQNQDGKAQESHKVGESASTTTTSTFTREIGKVEEVNNKELSSTTTTPIEHLQGRIPLLGKCNSTSDCAGNHVECSQEICKCEFGFVPKSDNASICGEANSHESAHQTLPTAVPQVQKNNNSTMTKNTTGLVPLRGKCSNTTQCAGNHTECRQEICKCEFGYIPRSNNAELCGEAEHNTFTVPQTDPTMIGVVVGLVLMSVTLCVVMRLFAKARFQENRTIFNTPNPRLMNVSLLKGSKSLLRGGSGGGGGQRSRRGSQTSVNSEGFALEGQGHNHHHHPHPHHHHESSLAPPKARTNNSSSSKPPRQPSTDTTDSSGPTPTTTTASTRPKISKIRQDSVASNSNV